MVSAASGWPSTPIGMSPGLCERRKAWSLTLSASSSPVRYPDEARQDKVNSTSPGRASGGSVADTTHSMPQLRCPGELLRQSPTSEFVQGPAPERAQSRYSGMIVVMRIFAVTLDCPDPHQ